MVGVKQEEAFQIMDGLTTSICDSCTPMITPIVSMACIDEKVVIVVTIQAMGQRPYYITAVGKEKRNLSAGFRNYKACGFLYN